MDRNIYLVAYIYSEEPNINLHDRLYLPYLVLISRMYVITYSSHMLSRTGATTGGQIKGVKQSKQQQQQQQQQEKNKKRCVL